MRYLWFGLPASIGASFIAFDLWMSTWTMPVDTSGWVHVVLSGFGLYLIVFGLLSLRVGFVADDQGVRVMQVGKRQTVPWLAVEDVILVKVQADVTVGLHQLVLVQVRREEGQHGCHGTGETGVSS